MPIEPDVFDYLDYRRYLEAWFEHRKERNRRFSHRAFARRVASRDPSLLINITKGRRPLPDRRLPDFVRVLGLADDGAEYFRQLVRFDQGAGASRDAAWAAIGALRARRQRPEIDGDRYLYVSRCLYPAVRTLAECEGFRTDAAWIASHLDPPVDAASASEALALLLRLGLLRWSDGRVEVAEPVVRTPPHVEHLGSHRYHRETLDLATSWLERLVTQDRATDPTVFVGATVAIPAARIEELRMLVYDALHRVLRECDSWPGRDRVFQVAVQAFPLSARTVS